jgi:hypothetical protein
VNVRHLDSVAANVYNSKDYSHFLRAFADAWLRADPLHKQILTSVWVKLIEMHGLDSNFVEKGDFVVYSGGSNAVELTAVTVTQQQLEDCRILVRLVKGNRVEKAFDIIFDEGADEYVFTELEKLLHREGFVTQKT